MQRSKRKPKNKKKKSQKFTPREPKPVSEQLDRGLRRSAHIGGMYATALEIIAQAESDLDKKQW